MEIFDKGMDTAMKYSTKYCIGQTMTLARKLYNEIPPGMRWIAYPFVSCFIRLQRLRLDLLRLDLSIVEGDELSSGKPLAVLCSAPDNETRSYLLELIFGKSYRERFLKREWVWNIPKVIENVRQSCSIIIIGGVFKRHCRLISMKNWFYVPHWISGEVDIPLSPSVMKKQSVLSDLRRIRRNALVFEITRDPQRLDDFYYNMYVPYITRAHSKCAYIDTYEGMRQILHDCDLLLVKKYETYIAGVIIWYENDVPLLHRMGIRDGNPEYVKDGAVGALYYFSSRYLEENGFTKMKIGDSRAFLHDGVLRLKRKWSSRISGASPFGFVIKVLSDTEATKAFLQNNPFIFEREGLLYGAIFVDQEKALSPEELRQIDKDLFFPGLSKLIIYDLQRKNSMEESIVPLEITEHIVLNSTENWRN